MALVTPVLLAASLALAQPPAASTPTVAVSSPAVAVPAPALTAPPTIQAFYPEEGVTLPAVAATYILGNVQPPTSSLAINGRPVKLHPKGGYLAYVPLTPGDFTFRLDATLDGKTTTLLRKVKVDAPPISPSTTTLAADPRTVLPASDLQLRSGDWVRASLRAPAGMKGDWRIYGVKKKLPLVESQPGLYEGAYQLQPEDRADGETIRYALDGPLGDLDVVAPGRLTIVKDTPRVAVVQRDGIEFNNVRGALGRGFRMFLPSGVKTVVTGRIGEEARMEFAPGVTGWLPMSSLRLLPEGTPPPRAVLGTIEATSTVRGSRIKLALTDTVPYTIEEQPGLVRVQLYGADCHTNWIYFDADDSRIRDVRWAQEGDGVARVDIWLDGERTPSGYDSRYAGGALELELRWPPPAPPKGVSPLSGTTIVLDPGHSPSDPGRLGPLGSTERQHNLRAAQLLEEMLKLEGATVILTRLDNQAEVNLQQRLDIAWQNRGDALVSFHNNALPDGVDPYAADRGFTVFYFHPHSRLLAESIHQGYRKRVPLADEGLKFADLFIPRTARLPSVLVESAYFIFPDQEQLLLDDAFETKVAKAVADGLRHYFQEVRKAKAPAPQKAEAPAPEPKKMEAPKSEPPKAAPPKAEPKKPAPQTPAAPKQPAIQPPAAPLPPNTPVKSEAPKAKKKRGSKGASKQASATKP